MLFDSAHDLVRVTVAGTLAYLSCIILMRISGNWALSKLNCFDLVVTVAIGLTTSPSPTAVQPCPANTRGATMHDSVEDYPSVGEPLAKGSC